MADPSSAPWLRKLQDGMEACAREIGDLSFENARLKEENEKLRTEIEMLRHMAVPQAEVVATVAEASELPVPMPSVFGQNEHSWGDSSYNRYVF